MTQLIESMSDRFTQKIAYNASKLAEYVGWAPAGSASSALVWKICKYTYDGTNITDVQWASGNTNFDKEWDERASYSYS